MTTNNHHYFKKAIITLLVIMAFFVPSCTKRIVIKEPSEKPALKKTTIDNFALGEKYRNKKQYNKALAAYDKYLKAFPAGNRARDALAGKARIYYAKKQYKKALPLFLEVIDQYTPERRAEIHLLTAKAYFYLKRFPESRLSALSWLELYEYYPQKEEVFSLLGRCLKELNEPALALYWWLKVYESTSVKAGKKERVKKQILDLVYQAGEYELIKMATYAEESDLLFPVNYHLALSYLESNKPEEAREIIKSIIESASDEEWKVKAQEVMQRIDYGPKVTPNSIGCLLPLSGPFAMYGEEVLRGIELGFDIFQERDATLESMELIIRDTAGDPGKGVEIIEEFTEQQKTFVTIGPLVTKVAEGAVQKAQEAGMPIITFSQSEDITSKGEMVFQNCLTPEDQLRSLLNKVVYEMGLARFAILYPDNSYGRYFMNKFWGEAEFRGGIITAVESYNPQDTDFAVQIKKMAGLFYPRPEPDIEEIEVSEAPEKVLEEPEEALEGEGEDEKEPEPIIDFDAVFIPDSHERVALIAPQLAYHDVVGVTLLGTNLWNSPELIGIAGKYVNGAIFPADFFYGSGYIGVDDFVEKYKSIFGRNPGFLAAVGYDTIRIIKEILKEKDRTIKTREDFRLSLTEERNYNSVTGPMFFDHQRRATRDPLLLTVRGRHFLPLP